MTLRESAAAVRLDAITKIARAPEFDSAISNALIDEWQRNTTPAECADDNHHKHMLAGATMIGRIDGLEKSHARIAFDDDSIRAKAKHMTHWCSQAATLARMESVAFDAGIKPPPETLSDDGRMNRLKCPKWWRRNLRRFYSRRAEGQMRELGLVNRQRGLYCSDATLKRRKQQKKTSREMLQLIEAINGDTGEVFKLFELIKSSLSNPELRRAELMVRIRGFEECAQAAGHVGEFLTFTTPSRFHAYHTDGRKNAKYQEGLSPRDAQFWLCRNWEKIRARLGRMSIRIYGFRVAEPHHDGTAHWHLLLFMPRHHRRTVLRICRDYLLADSGKERGAREHRFKTNAIDPNKGTAAGYMAKYVAKNIDGFSVGDDYEAPGIDASDTAPRVEAWAATWGIRQFQQIGGPPVGLWRELRRIESPIDCTTLERARKAADAGEWSDFVACLGGPTVTRDALPIALEKELSADLNEYGELRGPMVVGVRSGVTVVLTRLTEWFFEFIGAAGAAWTRVNNCTAELADEYEIFMRESEPDPPPGNYCYV